MANHLDASDHARIAEAIRQAESRTSGEIYCVLARQSASYFYPAATVLLLALLAASLVAAAASDLLWVSHRLPIFVGIQLGTAALFLLILRAAPSLAIRLTPLRTRYRTAHDNALRQFMARNVHRTEARTGVLIFVSLAEHYATVIADAGIDAHVEQATWNTIVGDLTDKVRIGELADGFLIAIEQAGALLGAHFPPAIHDRNELEDHLAEV